MNPSAEKKAAAVGLTYWEYLVLRQIGKDEKMLANSGSSALFDAGWAMQRRGLLDVIYVGNSIYLVMNKKGEEVLQKLKEEA